MRAYKVFNTTSEPGFFGICRGYPFKMGETYIHQGEVIPCKSGFHACLKLEDCFSYYSFSAQNKVAEVEVEEYVTHDEDSKVAARKITLIKELSWYEVLELSNKGMGNTGLRNSGHYNTGNKNSGNYNTGSENIGSNNCGHNNDGHCNTGNFNSGYNNAGSYNLGISNTGTSNSGNWNTGHYNTGSCNSGGYNSGNYNSGWYNSGNHNSGIFNENSPPIRCFNKETNLTLNEIDMPIANLCFSEVVNGITKKYTYKEAWANYWNSINEINRNTWKRLPNFDPEVFERITGIKV